MNKKQLKAKIKEVLRADKGFIDELINKAVNNMPASTLSLFEDDYRLPKMTISAIYKDLSRQYKPLNQNKMDDKIMEQIYSTI